jgi:AhpD family alkylhydroperoxidase
VNPRIAWNEASPETVTAILGMEKINAKNGLDHALQELVRLRASQINGCAVCLLMHTDALRKEGVSNVKIDLVNAWREAQIFSKRERAALAWTEAVTTLDHRDVPDAVYDEALAEFGEKGLADLTLVIVSINAWNRFNVAFRSTPLIPD